MSGTTACFRVTNGVQVGHLFLHRGQLFHARTGKSTGESAVYEMLSWQEGEFALGTLPAPKTQSISMPWQALLLRVAQARDEAERGDDAATLVPFPGSETEVPSARTGGIPRASVAPLPHAIERSSGSDGAPPHGLESEEDSGIMASGITAVRMAMGGDVLGRHGEPSELDDVAAYAARLLDLIGETLGLDEPERVQASIHGRKVELVLSNGSIVAAHSDAALDLHGSDWERLV